MIPRSDQICVCNHWYDEHVRGLTQPCAAPGCQCQQFRFSPENSAVAAVADRGGDPAKWPAHVKESIPEIGSERGEMTVEQMRDALKAGRRLRIVIGPGAEDPTIVLSLDGGMVMCESVAGWSAGVVEPACPVESDYLGTYLDHPIEVLAPGESGWR